METKKLCIVVPYRDREQHLEKFIPHMCEFLNKGKIDFTILIVEQESGKSFNRAKLLNIGFDYDQTFDYYCFHDIDMLPEESDYSYCDIPTHLASRAEQFGWKLPYPGYFGGVTIFDKQSFEKINGYSNEYWGWGGEDDDVYSRCKTIGINPHRKDGKYISLSHERKIDQTDYHKNVERLRNFHNFYDGYKFIEGLSTLEYELLSTQKFDNYTKITVKI